MGEGKKKQSLIWIFPAVIFNYFSDVYVMTYLFDCQPLRYYFEMNGLDYTKYRIADGKLVEHEDYADDTIKYRNLINIYQGNKNDIGNEGKTGQKKQTCLCANWYKRANEEQLKRLKDNLYGYFFNDLNRSQSDLNLWTCFKDYKPKLEGKGYIKGFLACNARATNDYRHKTAIAYPINVYMNPIIINFFKAQEITIEKSQQEEYALSEMLQWLWRSAIREDKPINLYIPSCRMRGILKKWLGIPK